MNYRVRYGWKPDLPDQRDFQFTPKFLWFLPKSVDLQAKMPPVYNQGECGSCTANAVCGGMQYLSIIEGTPIDFLSRLFLYFNAREMEGSIKDDAGAMLRDVIKSVATQGVCLETLWPYVVERFAIKPDAACYDAAVAVRALSYSRIGPSIRGMKSALAGGRPFVFGSMLYSSFETPEVASTGVVPMPVPEEQPVGGHAMMVVGYDDATNLFKVRNSWDIEWGDKGYCYMPYAYLGDHNLTDDRWVIQKSS